ncbi:MAG: preprotein translocase subunit YajC [Chlamydiales bacterium]|jgi:preprotein translocase subunit YajC
MFLALAVALQDAPAAGAAQAAPGFSWTPLILILGVVYFVLIAPERKNRKKRDEMLGGLKKGDKVMTTSGMHGTVAHVNGDAVTLQVADNVRLKFTVQAVQSLVDDSTEKAEKADSKQVEAKA